MINEPNTNSKLLGLRLDTLEEHCSSTVVQILKALGIIEDQKRKWGLRNLNINLAQGLRMHFILRGKPLLWELFQGDQKTGKENKH